MKIEMNWKELNYIYELLNGKQCEIQSDINYQKKQLEEDPEQEWRKQQLTDDQEKINNVNKIIERIEKM